MRSHFNVALSVMKTQIFSPVHLSNQANELSVIDIVTGRASQLTMLYILLSNYRNMGI